MNYPEPTSAASWLRRLAPASMGLCALAALGLTAAQPVSATTVTVDANTQFQTIEGFGSSLYGGAQGDTGPYFNSTFRTLFAQDLGCSIVRTEIYPDAFVAAGGNMGGPEVPLGTDIVANAANWDFAGGFHAVGPFVQWLETNALEPSRVKLFGSIWSPPQWAKQQADTNTYNGNLMPFWDGGGLTIGGTWKDDHFQYNARYISSFCQAYNTNVGFPLYAISIQNEVSFENPFNSCTLVNDLTNGIDNPRYASCLKAVKDEFALHSGLTTKIMGPHMANVGPDPSNMWGFNQQMSIIDGVKNFAADSTLKNFMAIYTNNYAASQPARCYAAYWNGSANVTGPWGGGTSTASIGADGKESWNSEAGGESPTWPGPLTMADTEQSALTYGNQSAYVYWQTCDGNAAVANETLIGTNDFANPTGSKKYCMFKHFSRYIRPGSKRVKMTFSNGTPSNGGSDQWDTTHATFVSAYTHTGDGRVTMVIVNERTVADTLTITVPTTPNVTTYNQFRTSSTENFANIGNLTVSGGTVTVAVPAQCVVTLTGVAAGGSIPPVPTGLTATGGNTQISLSWNASAGATSYKIYSSTSSGTEVFNGGTTSATSFVATGATNGTTYYYKVTAVNATGESGLSSEASATANAGTATNIFGTLTPTTVDSGPDSSVELGCKFKCDVAGKITGVRFYKASTNTGTHTGTLWSIGGTNMGTVTFSGETASGWQTANFASGIAISANTDYVISYHCPTGHYSDDQGYFLNSAHDNTPLHGLKDGADGVNGVFTYGASSVFPTGGFNQSNYWVDVVFSQTGSAPAAPTNLAATAGATQVALAWTASSGATSYSVYRGTTPGGESATAIVTGLSTTSYTNTGLTNGTRYYYTVKAVNASGTSGASNETSGAPYATSSTEAGIAHATTAPTIDGNNTDAIWSTATSYNINNIIPTVTNSADLSGTYQAAWDASNLYVLVTVTDESLIANLTDPTQGDSVEVYIDADNNKGTSYDANDWQYVFAYGGNVIKQFSGGAAGTNTTGVVYAYVNVTGGYRLELKIPWSTVGGTAFSGAALGLDVAINDADGAVGRQGKKIWNATADNDWTNPSLFGVGRDR